MQASFDLAGYILFFIPYFIIFVIAGYDLAFESIEMGERTVTGMQFIVPIQKIIIPLSAFFMLIAGFSQVLRCLHILISGKEVEI
jgi:TRAP-type mannitol/chloroaromatic compound transport system permease small subunit